MSAIDSLPGEWPAQVRRGLAIQRRVLVALAIRQLMTKYGRNNIGFLWIVLEPMILCGGVLLVRSFIQGSEEGGVSLVGMLWTGYIPLTLWRHITNAGVHQCRRSANLLYHRDISLFDSFASTIVIELGGCTIAGLLVYWGLYTFNLIEPVYDIGLVLYGWLMMGSISVSVMVCFAVLTEYYEAGERFVQPAQYLILPLCGFFWMVNWLPHSVQKLAIWVPTVNCYEIIRAGLFGPTVETFYMWWYPIVVSIIQLAIALPLVESARNKIHFG